MPENYIYILTTPEYEEIMKYKPGRHTGNLKKLEKRYITAYPNHIIHLMLPCDNDVQLENKILNHPLIKAHREQNKHGHLSEWVIGLKLDKIITIIMELKNKEDERNANDIKMVNKYKETNEEEHENIVTNIHQKENEQKMKTKQNEKRTKEYLCKRCDEIFDRKTDCRKDKKKKPKIKPKCPHCEKELSRPNVLIRHLTTCKVFKEITNNKINNDHNTFNNGKIINNEETINNYITLNVPHPFGENGIDDIEIHKIIEQVMKTEKINKNKSRHYNIFHSNVKNDKGIDKKNNEENDEINDEENDEESDEESEEGELVSELEDETTDEDNKHTKKKQK